MALGRSGVFEVVDRPELSRLVASLFGPPSMNLEGAAEAQFTALPSVAVALNDGSKSVTVYLQPTPSAEMLRSLQERPLRPGPVTKVAPPRSESENRIGFGYTMHDHDVLASSQLFDRRFRRAGLNAALQGRVGPIHGENDLIEASAARKERDCGG